MNERICKVIGCENPTSTNHSYRCLEHLETCLAQYCDTPSIQVRCGLHAGRYSRLRRSHLDCIRAGCRNKPTEDYATCPAHRDGVTPADSAIEQAIATLELYGTVRFTRHSLT